MTAWEAQKIFEGLLAGAGADEPAAKARVIVSHALGIGLGEIASFGAITPDQKAAIAAMARRCAKGEPVQYVTGRAYFRHLVLAVTPDVLIPRPETEQVAQAAIDWIRQNEGATALDVCTGSGCIAISMATETDASVDACDISASALAVARRNAEKSGAGVRFFSGDMFEPVTGVYDIIVCNPPYVSEAEYAALHDTVRRHEPGLALLAGDGLMFYRVIARDAPRHLRPGGALVLEIGAQQAKPVTALLERGGFCGIQCLKDYAGRDRIVTARMR